MHFTAAVLLGYYNSEGNIGPFNLHRYIHLTVGVTLQISYKVNASVI